MDPITFQMMWKPRAEFLILNNVYDVAANTPYVITAADVGSVIFVFTGCLNSATAIAPPSTGFVQTLNLTVGASTFTMSGSIISPTAAQVGLAVGGFTANPPGTRVTAYRLSWSSGRNCSTTGFDASIFTSLRPITPSTLVASLPFSASRPKYGFYEYFALGYSGPAGGAQPTTNFAFQEPQLTLSTTTSRFNCGTLIGDNEPNILTVSSGPITTGISSTGARVAAFIANIV